MPLPEGLNRPIFAPGGRRTLACRRTNSPTRGSGSRRPRDGSRRAGPFRRRDGAGGIDIGLAVTRKRTRSAQTWTRFNAMYRPEQALHRPDRHAQIGAEGDQRTQRHAALDDLVAADDEYRRTHRRSEIGGHRRGGELGQLQAAADPSDRPVELSQPLLLALRRRHALDILDRRQRSPSGTPTGPPSARAARRTLSRTRWRMNRR